MDAFNSLMASKGSDAVISEAKEIMNELSKRGVSPSGATPIPQDDKIFQTDKSTGSEVDTFAQQQQKSIAASVGGSAVSTYKDIAIGNYASIKAAIAFDEEGYKIEFDNLVDVVINDYLARLFTVGVQMGRIKVDRLDYFENPFKHHKWDVLRVSKRSVDEKVASQARKNDIASGATTLRREYGEKGLDYIEEMKKQIAADVEVEKLRKKAFEDAGLNYKENE
jgi:capsid protein